MNSGDNAKSLDAASSDRTMFALLRAAHAMEDRLEATLGQVGLSAPKFSLLAELVSAGRPLSLGELAVRLSCVKSNMTQLVDRLEAEGLVRRADDPKDRRAVLATITDLGRERQAAGAAEVEKLHDEFEAKVPVADRAAVARVLNALE